MCLNPTGYPNESNGNLQISEATPENVLLGHGGYDCKFVESPTEDLETKCDICLLVLRNPHQTQCCGSLFCESCVEWVQQQKQPCPECNEAEFSTFYDKSLERTLNELKVRCIHEKRGCAWTGELVELDRHLNMSPTCDKLLVGCEFVDINCEFSNAGCKVRVPRKDMEAHRNEPHHIKLLAEALKERDKQVEELTMELQSKDELLEQYRQQMQDLTSKLQKIKQQQVTIKQQATNVGLQLRKQLPDASYKQVTDLIRANRELQLLLDTPTPRKPSAGPSQTISVNRCFIMDNFEFHMTNNKIWCSEPFYTHEQGYKMCLQTYPNGFDKECGTHLSLYTCFLRGEFDDQLQWPFHGKIAVELLDQNKDDLTQGRHHECIMHYGDNTPDRYAQRVTVGDKGPGWGKSQFIPHFKFDPENDPTVRYLKDDCLKFRVCEVLLYT